MAVCRPVAKFAEGIPAHRPKTPVCLHDQAVDAPPRDRLHPTGKDLDRRILLGLRPVTELAAPIRPHGPQAPVRLQNQAVIIARDDCLHAAGDNLHRNVSVGCRPVAELAISICAHGPQAPVRLQNQAVPVGSGRDRQHAPRKNLHGQAAISGRPVTQFAVPILAHGPQASVGLQNQDVLIARRDRLNIRSCLTRMLTLKQDVVAQLPAAIQTEGPQFLKRRARRTLREQVRRPAHLDCRSAVCRRRIGRCCHQNVAVPRSARARQGHPVPARSCRPRRQV